MAYPVGDSNMQRDIVRVKYLFHSLICMAHVLILIELYHHQEIIATHAWLA